MLEHKTIGVGITGSACSFAGLLPLLRRLREHNRVIPILSPTAATQDTRFFTADAFCRELETITGEHLITTIPGAEPIGPQRLLDVLLLAPCTSNTMAKLCHGITDTPVLAGADVGAAMGSGADAAIEAADVVFLTSRASAVPVALDIARRTKGIAWQNVVFALAVKLLVMVLGLLGCASMWAAVFADSGVAMLCVLNAIRLLYRKK